MVFVNEKSKLMDMYRTSIDNNTGQTKTMNASKVGEIMKKLFIKTK